MVIPIYRISCHQQVLLVEIGQRRGLKAFKVSCNDSQILNYCFTVSTRKTYLLYYQHLKSESSSPSCCAGSTDIPDPLSPLLPIVHRPR